MRKTLAFGSVLAAAALLASGTPATAQEDFEPHPHMLVLGLEVDEQDEPIGFRKCVDLAAGRPVPLHAHHGRLHFGETGMKLEANAGHVVVPGAPFPAPFADPLPWSNCDELIAIFFGE